MKGFPEKGISSSSIYVIDVAKGCCRCALGVFGRCQSTCKWTFALLKNRAMIPSAIPFDKFLHIQKIRVRRFYRDQQGAM